MQWFHLQSAQEQLLGLCLAVETDAKFSRPGTEDGDFADTLAALRRNEPIGDVFPPEVHFFASLVQVIDEEHRPKTIVDATVEFRFEERGAKVARADLIYSLNGGDRYEEWFRIPATVRDDERVSVLIPENATHAFINLIDENNFLVSHPTVAQKKAPYAESAIKLEP